MGEKGSHPHLSLVGGLPVSREVKVKKIEKQTWDNKVFKILDELGFIPEEFDDDGKFIGNPEKFIWFEERNSKIKRKAQIKEISKVEGEREKVIKLDVYFESGSISNFEPFLDDERLKKFT